MLAHGHDPINDSINHSKVEGGGGGYLSQENNKNAGEMKINVAGIVDREELFQ